MEMSFWEAIKSAPTYDLVFASIAVVLILATLVFFTYLGIKGKKEKKMVEVFVMMNTNLIEGMKYRIMTCSNLDKFNIIKRWAKAVTQNLKNEMINISYDYGCEYGNKIIKDINNLLSIREEQLTSRVITLEM